MAALAIAAMAGIAMCMVSIQVSSTQEQHRTQQESRAVLAAEAGLSRAYMDLQNGGAGNVGSGNYPASIANGDVVVVSQAFGPTNNLRRVTARASVGESNASAELILAQNVSSMWQYAAFGDTELHLDSNARVDSYNSELGLYATQVTGSGSTAHALSNGDVGSNGDLDADSNVKIWGDATPGPGSTATITGNATVSGSTAAAPTPVAFPPIVVPVIASSGALVGNNQTLASGNYRFTNATINASKTLTVIGPATIVVDNFECKSNSKFIVNATGGPVELIVLDDFVLNSNALMYATDYKPKNLSVKLLSDNIVDPTAIVQLDELEFDSNAKLWGTIYAPDALLALNSNFELFGAMMAEEVDLDSNSRVHFDESLSSVLNPGEELFSRISWRVLH